MSETIRINWINNPDFIISDMVQKQVEQWCCPKGQFGKAELYPKLVELIHLQTQMSAHQILSHRHWLLSSNNHLSSNINAELLTKYLLGGIYGPSLNNPATSAQNCPTGYTASQFSQGSTNPVLYSCDKVYVNGDTITSYNGFYSSYEWDGYYAPYIQVNLLTLDLTCPKGTTTITATNAPYPLYFCY